METHLSVDAVSTQNGDKQARDGRARVQDGVPRAARKRVQKISLVFGSVFVTTLLLLARFILQTSIND